MPQRALALVAAIALVLSLAGCSFERRLAEGEFEHGADEAFYVAPTPQPAGSPGEVVRTAEIGNPPDGARAWRVLYHSTDAAGDDVLVSGVVVVPTGKPPASGRLVVSWAHPTTGVAARCAPSTSVDPFDLIEGLSDLLGRGYAVVATDYLGMGVPGPNQYLVGATAGRTVLDIVRAARGMPQVDASDRVLLWGHSQGGHAALFAAQEARAYAPELDVLAVAVAAPATDLATLLSDDIDDVSGVTIGSYAFSAYADTYGPSVPGAHLADILTPAAANAVPEMVSLCLLGQNAKLHEIATPLIGGFLSADPTTTEPWAGLLHQNTPGGSPIGVPLFVAQGTDDELVRPAATAAFVRAECAAGADVTFLHLTKTGHGLVALRALPHLLPWFDEVLAGQRPNGC